MIDWFKRALQAIQEKGRPDPGASRADLEAQVKGILDEYHADIVGDLERPPPRAGWVFKRHVDHELYLQALLALFHQALAQGRQEGAAALADQLGYQCACRCRAHGRYACPKCLNVYGCPVHSEADPKVLRPEFLKDPEAVARAIHGTYGEIAGELGAILGHTWAGSAEEYRAAFTEAVRRVVTVRYEARRE